MTTRPAKASAIHPIAQIAMHVFFMAFYNAQSQGLIPDDASGKWATCVMGSVQSVLAIYGIFSPSPTSRKRIGGGL